MENQLNSKKIIPKSSYTGIQYTGSNSEEIVNFIKQHYAHNGSPCEIFQSITDYTGACPKLSIRYYARDFKQESYMTVVTLSEGEWFVILFDCESMGIRRNLIMTDEFLHNNFIVLGECEMNDGPLEQAES